MERAGAGATVRGRNAQVEQQEHASYPPTSYPQLGRTLSAVKRTIRADQERAFSGASSTRWAAKGCGELPGSVTVDRPGNGRRRAGAGKKRE